MHGKRRDREDASWLRREFLDAVGAQLKAHNPKNGGEMGGNGTVLEMLMRAVNVMPVMV